MVKLRIGKVKARNTTKPLYQKIYQVEEKQRALPLPVIVAPEPPPPPPKPASKSTHEPRRKISVTAVRAAVYDTKNKLAPFSITFFGITMPDFWTSAEGASAREMALNRHKLHGFSLRPYQ